MTIRRYILVALLAFSFAWPALAAPPQYPGTGVGALWVEKAGDFSMTYRNGDAGGVTSADAYLSPTGLALLGPGTESLTLPSYRAGVCWIWQRYDAYRITGTPLEAWPRGVRQMRVDSSGVVVDSNLTSPRFGPRSTATTGGAIRVVDGNRFPLTVSGVQAALNECGAAGGGTTLIPGTANIQISTVGIKIPNRVRLMGMGALYDSIPTFQATSTCNVGALIENAKVDGTQQVAQIEHISVYGDTSGTATDSAGIRLRSIFVGSYVRDVLVLKVKGHGIVVDDPSASGVGTVDFENVVVGNLDITEGGDGIRIGTTTVGFTLPIRFRNLDIERWGLGGAGLRLQGVNCSGSSWSRDAVVDGLYLEGNTDPTATGLHIENFGMVDANNIDLGSGGPLNYLVKIAGAPTSSFCGAYGVTLRNMFIPAAGDTILFDQVNNVGYEDTNGGHLSEYRTPSKSPAAIPYIINSDSIRVSRITGNPTVGSSGLATFSDFGLGGTGATHSTLRLNAGNSGTTRSQLTFARNGSTLLALFVDGSSTYYQADTFLKLGNLSGTTKAILDFTNGTFRVGDGTAATQTLELAGSGKMTLGSTTQGSLGTPANGTMVYCSDCTKATPCAGGGGGAVAFRINGAWDCNP